MNRLRRFALGNFVALVAGTAAVVAYMKDEKFKASTDKALKDIKDTAVKVGEDVKVITKEYIDKIKEELEAKKEAEPEVEEVQELPEDDHIDTI